MILYMGVGRGDRKITAKKGVGGGGGGGGRGFRVLRWCWVNFQCRRVLLIWITVGHEPTTLAEGAVGRYLDIFFSSVISLFFLPLSGKRPDID